MDVKAESTGKVSRVFASTRESSEPQEITYSGGETHNVELSPWLGALPYLPTALIDALNRSPNRAPAWIEPLEGTLVFADISGFTRMSERLAELGKEGAERLTSIINHYFSLLLDIARSHGGGNLKFGGDALLLLFTGQDHAACAVASALAMIRTTRESPTVRIGRDRIRVSMRVGVHSGTFWSASAGMPAIRLQHFLLGQEACRVAEAEEHAQAGEVHITEDTMNLVSGLCTVEPRTDTYRVLRISRGAVTLVAPQENGKLVAVQSQHLAAYLPPPLVQALRVHGQAEGLEGEHRKVSIMFINVLETEETLREHSPEVLLNELQRYVSLVVELTNQYGGFLVSNDIYTHGLKLILVFGAPVAHEQDSANAFRLALELKDRLPELNVHLRHRIGINSGFVFAGDVGASFRREYTVMGDAVNLAARLMSAASAGQVLVSQQMLQEAGPGFIATGLEPIMVKGKQKPIPICSLEGERAVSLSIGTDAEAPLLGREEEMGLLRLLCDEVEGGKGRNVVIAGEAGMGKTRLLLEFEQYLSARRWTIYKGQCQSHTMASPFAPWVHILRSFFRITPDESTDARTQKTLATIKRLRPDLLEIAPLLNGLFQLSVPPTDVFQSLDTETRRVRLFDLVTALLQTAAVDSPTAIVLEDLHWADNSSLQMVRHMGANLSSSHLALFLTNRPREGLEYGLPTDATITLFLKELQTDASLQLLRGILGQQELPSSVAEAILAKAGGNPLFLEEIARSISQSHAQGQLLALSESRTGVGVSALQVPDRLQGLIMSRIDSLGDTAKVVLRAASVIGQNFDVPTLKPLLDRSSEVASLEDQLQQLVQLGFVNREEVTQFHYSFKHTLAQEIAYDSLLFARRRNLHHRVASYLQDAHREDIEAFFETLLHHYTKSGDHPNTLVYAVKSADKASKVFAHEEAIGYFQQGLGALREIGGHTAQQRSFLLERIGDCHEDSGYHEQASRAFSQALRAWHSAARQTDDSLPMLSLDMEDGLPTKVREAKLRRKIGLSYERVSKYDASLKWLGSALRVLPPRQPSEAGLISIAQSVSLFRKGRYQEAIQFGRKGLQLSSRKANPIQLAYAHNMLGNSYVELGKLKEALSHRETAVYLYEEAGDLNGQAIANNNLASCHQMLGQLYSALHHYELSLAACERIGNPIRAAVVHNNIGEVLMIQGRLAEAVEHLKKVVETYERMGDPLALTGLAMVNLSRVYQCEQLYEQSLECLEEGIKLLRRVGARGLLTEAFLQQADLARDTGNIEAAYRTCQRALGEARESGMRVLEARGLRILAHVELDREHVEQSESYLRQSANIAASHKANYERGLALLSLAKLHSTREQRTRQRYVFPLRQAIAIFRRLGAEQDLQEALKTQAEIEKPSQG